MTSNGCFASMKLLLERSSEPYKLHHEFGAYYFKKVMVQLYVIIMVSMFVVFPSFDATFSLCLLACFSTSLDYFI